jgi:arylsulfatase A-like enzyme
MKDPDGYTAPMSLRPLPIARWILCGLLLGSCAPTEPPKPSSAPSLPSIVLISFDTCRADVFGVLSGDRPSLTPHLDAFAADAVIFENAFVQIPHTLPSHMSLFTSVYPDVHGVKHDFDPLPPSLTTLPEILHENGFRTVGLVTSEWLKADFGFGRGFDEYRRLRHGLTYAGRVNAAALDPGTLSAAADSSLFLFLHYYDLHSDFDVGFAHNKFPYYSPPAYRAHLDVSADGREFCDQEQNCNTRYLIASSREGHELARSELETIHGLYRAAVPYLDAQMGSFFDNLKRRDLYDGSLIVITSDHGEEFREHGRLIHSQPYDETIHVPLFVKFPHSWKAGTRISDVVETVDIAPTLLDHLGIEPPESFQGESLMPLIEGRPGRHKHTAVSQDTIVETRYGLRTDRAKLITDVKSSRRELYDLRADPGETVNVADRRAELASELEARLKRQMRANRLLARRLTTDRGSRREVLSAEERERLKALGYLN